ncbi:signal peptidase I [bacterium]|nr:signal peptidase I [bacterium]
MDHPNRISRKKDRKKKTNYFAWVAISIVIGVIIAYPILGNIRGFVVSSDYMERAVKQGDFIMVNFADEGDDYSIGDVIVFQYPPERSQYRFGRIIASEGQTVQIYKKTVYVDNLQYFESSSVFFEDRHVDKSLLSQRDYFGPFQVPAGTYFILGDNRDNSIDSRNWAELPKDNIIGKPKYIYFSWKPDPNTPSLNSPPDYVKSFFYNLFHGLGRIGFNRIGKKII